MVGQDYGEEHPHGLAMRGAMRVPVQWAWFLTSVFQYSGCWILTIKWDVLELNAGVMVTVSKWKILYKANKKVETFVNWKPFVVHGGCKEWWIQLVKQIFCEWFSVYFLSLVLSFNIQTEHKIYPS